MLRRMRTWRAVAVAIASGLVLMACSGGATSVKEATGESAAAAGASSAPPAPSDGGGGTTAAGAAVTVAPDDARTAAKTIGVLGGKVTAKAADGTVFTLVVPKGALPGDTKITATPATLDGAPAPTYTVLFGPTGLQFLDWARLTIAPPSEVPVENQFLYQLNDSGTEFSWAFSDPKAKAPTILLDHFSGYGLANATEPQRAAFLEKQASAAEARIQGELAAILGQERRDQLLGSEGNGGAVAAAFEKYSKQYEEEVIKPRLEAAGGSCEATQKALQTVLGYERQRQLLGAGGSANVDAMQILNDALNASNSPCEKEAIEKCKKAKDPSILISYWLGIERQKQLLGSEGAGFDLQGLIDKAIAICDPRAYEATASIPSAPSGITLKGTICALDKPFNVTASGDYVGTMAFAPRGKDGGHWEFDGVVGNAPFSVDGSGAYTVTLQEDRKAGSIDLNFKTTIHIPSVGSRSGGGPVAISLKATSPCPS